MTQKSLPRIAWSYFPSVSIFLLLAASPLSVNADESAKLESEKFFEAKVRPILVQRCSECHGVDEQNADLRFDQNPFTENGHFAVPGKPAESKLVKAVRYEANTAAMPPDRKLPDEEIQILTQWIEAGAYWPKEDSPDPSKAKMLPPAKRIDQIREEHWAYQPIKSTQPPEVDNPLWAQHPIDRFLFAKLQQAGLEPNKPADKRTLMLRAHFVLTGLPPAFEEVENFVADDSPDALNRLVERLLQSSHYGERWARHWLDIARFAETTGYQAGSVDTTYPYAYTYRDYVINAFNSDKPFDRFVMEQIAADRMELKDDEKSGLAGLGYLTVGRKFMGNTHDIIDDRIDVVTRGFLGLSVTCARCHDHKYDPIPTADYYSLYGVFASTSEPGELPLLGNPEENPQYVEFVAARQAKESEVEAWLDKKRLGTEKELRSRVADYLDYFAKVRPNSGHSDVKQIGERGALRPQATNRWKKYLEDEANSTHPVWIVWKKLSEIPAEGFAVKARELLIEQSSSSSLMGAHQGLLELLRSSAPESMEAVAKTIGQQFEAADAAWLSAREKDSSITRLPDDLQEQLRAVLYEEDAPTVLTLERMRTHLNQAERNEYNQQLGKIKAVESQHPGAPGRAMAINDNANPHNPVVFLRGQPGNRGDAVQRRFLQVLSHVDGGQPFANGSGRLELARAIANPQNPLTARVIVNRVWQQHFGFGLVRTASDFGSRGEPPTHPELLDYLAAEFISDGWSIKRLQQRIISSAAWQQASDSNAKAQAIDAENRLLWRMPRRRLEFEPLRDRWLIVSGNLDQRIGGRSVKIHEDAKRRGLYAYIDREDVPSLLASFDVPSPDASQALRSRTTVPQQALFMINSKFLIEQAKSLASKTSHITDTNQRIVEYYRRVMVREPNASELGIAKQFLDPSMPPLPGATPVGDGADESDSATWRFGYGSWDEATGKVSFTELPHFTGQQWQASSQFPDPALGYLAISAGGGHPGQDPAHASVVRWTANGKAVLSIRGKLKHENENGDGVRARIVSSRTGLVASWDSFHAEINTGKSNIEVEPGDTLDFIVECRDSDNSDSYQWSPIVKVDKSLDGKIGQGNFWKLASDFEAASNRIVLGKDKLDPWAQFAQVLLSSNEFAFVD